MAPGLQDLEIIPFRVAAYDSKARKMAFFEQKRSQDFIFISGTKMRSELYSLLHFCTSSDRISVNIHYDCFRFSESR